MAESISQILVLASELIKPPPPIVRLVETTRSLQLTEPTDDEFLGVEMHRLTWANLSYSSGMQHGHCGVEAEEVEPPSVWPITLDPIKEGAMTVVQQALPEEVAMTVRDEALTRQRDRPQFNVAPERRSGSGHDRGRSRLEIRTVAKLVNSVAARVGRSVMAHVFSRRPSNRCAKSIVPVVLVAVGEPSGVSDARSLPEPSGRLWQDCRRQCSDDARGH